MIGKLLRWMKGHESIEAIDTTQRQIRQESEGGNPIRMSLSTIDRNNGNRISELLECMKEDKRRGVTNNIQMKIRQESKGGNSIPMSRSKASSSFGNRISELLECMKEGKRRRVTNNIQMKIRQGSRVESRTQIPNARESCSNKNSFSKCFQLMQECKYNEARSVSRRSQPPDSESRIPERARSRKSDASEIPVGLGADNKSGSHFEQPSSGRDVRQNVR
jgi:hypothetical protein